MTKKEMIKNGEDVSLDNGEVVVLNGISVAEKQEETEKTDENEVQVNEETQGNQQNITSEDAPKEEVTAEEANVPKVDEPSVQIPVSSETPQIPTAPIDLTGIITPESKSTANDDTVYPQMPSDSFVNSFSSDTPVAFNSDAEPSYTPEPVAQDYGIPGTSPFNGLTGNYDSAQTILPEGVQKAIDMVKNEVEEVVRKNKTLSEENDTLKKENNSLRADLSDMSAKVTILENKISGMQSSMAAAQSRILDVFGMGGMATGTKSDITDTSHNSFGDDQNNNNYGSMAA